MHRGRHIKETTRNREQSKKEEKMNTRTPNKKRIFTAVLAAGMLLIAAGILLQPLSAEAKRPYGGKKSPEQTVEQLTESLGLTDEQILAIQPVIEEKAARTKEIRTKFRTDKRAARLEMRKLQWDTQIKLNDILSKEQIGKYLELKQKRRGTFKKGKFRGSRIGRGFNKTPEQVIARMANRLDLTNEQAAAIAPVIEESLEEKQAVFGKYEDIRRETKTAIRKEMLTIHDETEAKLSTILTEDQMEDLRAFWNKKRARMDERRHRGRPMGY